MDHYRISDMRDESKPRERLFEAGPDALSDQELLAILLGSGTREMNVLDLSNKILIDLGGLGGLRKVTAEELNRIRGIGKARSAGILAAIELGRRFAKAIMKNDDRVRINCAEDVYEYIRYEMESLPHEELHILCLDTKHFLMGEEKLYMGTINTSNIRAAEIFRKPILMKAASFVMVHNHPSGDPTPSAADIVTTRNVIEMGKKLDLPLLDHVIIGSGRYASIKEYLN